jgi:murein DD-endopeptidase MepM/ murein hydrolase activator NlpD
MTDATVVGSTRVTLTPDTSKFGDELRVELPKAIREPATLAGDLAGDIIGTQIRKKIAALTPTVKVDVRLDDALTKTQLAKLTADRTIKVTTVLDDKAAVAALTKLTADRTVKVTADADTTTAKTAIDKLIVDRTVKVTVDLDDKAATATLARLTRGLSADVDVVATANDASFRRVEAALDKLTKDRVVSIRATVDTRVAANEIANLVRRQVVRIGADVDTRVAAADLANLTQRRTARITANADTTAADLALNHLARTRTADIRVNATGLNALTSSLGSLGSSGGSGGAGLGLLSNRIVLLAGAAISALPTLASLGSALIQMGPAAALAAPGVLLLGTAFGALKLGLSGVGDAIKAAFTNTPSEAKAAATATKGVETAQRSLANAQRGVTDAERNLTEAQRTARQAQGELSAARRQAARDLADMNAQLHQGALDQKQAALDVQQAEVDLAAVRNDPAATQLQIQQADLALQKAKEAATEQTRQQKRLAADTAAANKAGVAGAAPVIAAKEKIRQADLQVAAQERAVQDAHRAVADAARAVADAQASAAAQTSKLDTALSKLSPNARAFVAQLQAMAPAWRGMKLDVQDSLFAGIATRLGQVGAQILPTVRSGLVGTAHDLNTMGRNALTAVSNLQKTGQLKGIFDVVRTGLGNLSRIPAQLITGLSQVSTAAAPAFDRLTKGAASTVDKVMAKLSAGLKSGGLTDAINTALDVAVQFGHVLGDIGGIFKNVFGAAAKAGGDFFGVVGASLKEIRKITALPEVQAALTSVFTAINAIAKLLAGTLGAAIQAVLPILASLSPVVTQIAGMLGPVIASVLKDLGKALLPVAKQLGPVLVVAAKAVIALVDAIAPILPIAGDLLASLLPPLVPLFVTLAGAFQQAAPLVHQLADALGVALRPVISGIGVVLAQISAGALTSFKLILGQLIPILPQLTPALVQLGQSIGAILVAVAPLLPQLALLGVQLLVAVLPALIPLLPPLIKFTELMTRLATAVITQIVIPSLTRLVSYLAALAKKFQPAVDAVKWLTKAIADSFRTLYDVLLGHSIIPNIVNGAISWFTSLWHRTVDIFGSLKDGAVKKWDSLWSSVRATASSAWSSVRKGFDAFGDGLQGAFRNVRDGIGKIWKGLQNLVKAPVKFWISTVYNDGIRKVWNATAAKIPGIGNMSTMAMPKGFARGGVLPGYSTYRQGDDQLVPMRRGEGVYVSEAMRDPYERARLHAVNQAAMQGRSLHQFRGFAEGGIFGAISDVGSSISSGVSSVLHKGAGAVRGGLADLASKALKPVKSGITKALGTNKNTWPGAIGQAPLGMIAKVIDYIRGKDVVASGGQWIKPVNVPYGTRFGARGRMWSSGMHTGLDFPAPTGTRVGAVDSGTVSSATSGGPYGRHLMLNHGGGLQSLYAHMSAIAAKVGQAMAPGDHIGSVGATGNVTGPHLHLEARVNGRAVDPMKYLEGGNGPSGGKGVERWRGVVTQALGQVHQSLSLANTTLRRMNQESGGNPTAVNRNDINWQMGHPSVGLMQVIKGTFDAYAGKYKNTGPKLYGVSVDPMANIYASMRYAISRYGSLSRAYDRPGGYALGGIVGGGVRINTGLRRAPSGYASGGIINVGGKRIDTGPVRASVGGDFLKQLASTSAAINTAMTKVATALKNAFKGVKTTLDDKLIKQVTTANTQLKKLAADRDKIAATITTAKAFATDTANNASSFASLTGLPNSGLSFDVTGIQNGLNVRLGQLKAFSKNIATLGKRGLSKVLLQQLIAAGPDQGAPYAAALVSATDAQLKSINTTETAIGKATTAYGQDAADAMYDAGAQSGKGFLTGLTAQEKSIENAMSALAKKIQAAIKKALKIKSPSRVFAELGQFTVQGFAQGMRAATPQAAAAATNMAAVVRSTTAAAAARTENNTSTTTVGDRVLNYSATTREVASRQSVLNALAMDDAIHRPVLIGS